MHAAPTRGCRVTTTTISREQHALAVQRVARGRPRGSRDGAARGLPRAAGDVRQARLDRDDRGRRLEATSGRSSTRCARLLEPDGAMALQAITVDDRALRRREGLADVHPQAHLPQRLPAVDRGHRPRGRPPTPTCGWSTSRTSRPHYAETLRRWRANIDATPDVLARARLRRALPAALAAVPVLVRGRLRRAPHRRRADRPRQAALARRGRQPARRRVHRGARGRRAQWPGVGVTGGA